MTSDEVRSPNESHARVWAWLENALTESARARNTVGPFADFDRYLDLYYGKHYPETLPSYRPPVVVNELRSLLLQEANDLTDPDFRPYVLKDPTKGGRDLAAERALRAVWVRDQIDLKIIEAVVWYEVFGSGFLRVGWDPDLWYGMGDVSVDVWDPRNLFPDPDAADERKVAFLAYESVMDLDDIRRLFPKNGYEVKAEDQYSVKDPANEAKAGTNVKYPYVGPLTETDTLIGAGVMGYKKARARVIDMFVKDPTTEKVMEELRDKAGKPVLDPLTQEPILEPYTRMKYPNGRRIVGANGVILYDSHLNAPDHGLLRIVLEPTLGSFWGKGLISQTGELQIAADKMESAVVENAIRLNNGLVIFKGNHGLDLESFVSIPGQIVGLNAGADIDIKYPPQMPADMVQAGERMLNLQRRILGFSEQRMGQGGRGNVSPDLTETDISQSQAGTRLRAKFLYHAVQRLCEMIFARMVREYTTTRYIPAVEGEKFEPIKWEPVERPERYAVYVDPVSFQVMSRSALRRLCLALYKMQAIDRRAVLETLGWPDWEAVAQRLDKNEQMMAMAKLQARSKGRGK